MKGPPIVPGRGLVTKKSTKERIEFLEKQELSLGEVLSHDFALQDISNNIESFVGAVQVPLGLVGPLLFKDGEQSEYVYGLAATLEGALVASMNRGARAISFCGGFTAECLGQRMVRAPMFLMASVSDGEYFIHWVEEHYFAIKEVAESYSNHAELQQIEPFQIDTVVHLRFVYTTCDAAGQNMTTGCTWHAMLWMIKQFENDTGIGIVDQIIEGNAASDKKVSTYVLNEGRGIGVVARCQLERNVVRRIFRTNPEQIVEMYHHSVKAAEHTGMMAYNINVANAIAAIFLATGQDMGSVHESALGTLRLGLEGDDLVVSLHLPSLVIGSLGGGTSLPRQKSALELMKCYGQGKVERLAKLIAGFALSLEISTLSAVRSGEFAKAHEKLGRNKPVDLLLRSELNHAFIQRLLEDDYRRASLEKVSLEDRDLVENGILTVLTSRTGKKLIGFIPLQLDFKDGDRRFSERVIIKSKGLDTDVINGLHLMAASIDTKLADLLFEYSDHLEYRNCHLKEMAIYGVLKHSGLRLTPAYYGHQIEADRETYLFMMEYLDEAEMLVFNSENRPEEWHRENIESVLRSLYALHSAINDHDRREKLTAISRFQAGKAIPLYKALAEIVAAEENDLSEAQLNDIRNIIDELDTPLEELGLPIMIIHNDFNPRNVGVRKDGRPVVYDWELAVRSLPHRDVIEFLSFVLPITFKSSVLLRYLRFYHQLAAKEIPWSLWREGYIRALKEYIASRLLFYEAANILMKLKFSDRVLKVSLQMLQVLQSEATVLEQGRAFI